MIDLSRTRAELLAEIEAPDIPFSPLTDITDPRVATEDVRVCVCGRGRVDLFPLLKLALSERFRAVPRLNLTLDLLMPLKNAMGNAYKHGNAMDPAKAVSLEIVLTAKGAFIAVTDQGEGFDVVLTFRRFQEQEDYFSNFGIGFRNLHRAKATVSYENGGRTVLLCYRPGTDAPEESSSRASALSKAFIADRIQTCLSAELPEFANGGAQLESCRVYPAVAPSGDDCGSRYVLRVAGHDGGAVEMRILTGRLHKSETAARADLEAAVALHEAKISKTVRIPRPLALLAGEPRLVLYDFDSWLDLGEYLTYRGKVRSARHCVGRFGRVLARLHRSQLKFPATDPHAAGARLQAMAAHAEATLLTLPSGQDLVNRFRISIRRASGRGRPTPAPIHGALSWDCIRCGVDGEFYLYRFESCCQSDPRLDLGGFVADLLCFALAAFDDAAYRLCSNAFLSYYNSKAEYPVSEDDLQPYIVLALCERLQRDEPSTKTRAPALRAALDTVLCDMGAAIEVSS